MNAISFGSRQLRDFRRARRDGASVEEAATLSGLTIGEARLTAKEDDANPPPPEAFEPITQPVPALGTGQTQEPEMARTARAPKEDAAEVKVMDFDRAKTLYLKDIKPAKTQASSHGQAVAEAIKVIKKHCHIEPQGAKAAFKAFELEEAHREVHIRSFVGMLNALLGREVLTANFGDLVDQMESEDGYKRPPVSLVAVPPTSDGTEEDLADAGEFEEASEEELAQQEGRGASGD